MTTKKPLEIDCVAGSQLRDSQGEMLSVEGCDISKLENGSAIWTDNHGKGFFNNIGRITYGKKIFKEEDCEDDRQKYYWEKVRAPFIYAKGYLYDDEDHPNARAAAAVVRNIHKSDCPLKMKSSVEGGVVSRGISDSTLLARTKLTGVALTLTPANQATLLEPIGLDKSSYDQEADLILIKSVIHLAETNVPSFRHIARDASASKVVTNIEKIAELVKGNRDIEVPTKQEVIQYALEAKIQSNILKIHEMVDIVKQEDMEKGLKANLARAAMMGAAALTPQAADAGAKARTRPPHGVTSKQVNLANMPAEHQSAYKEYARKNPLLGAIGLIESSGGKNYAHRQIKNPNSIHSGHVAGGMFGMMPNAAEYALRSDPQLQTKYPNLTEAAKDMKTNHAVFTDTFNSDPQAAFDFADSLLRGNKNKTKDINMLIHSWNHGLKGTWERYKNEGPEAIQDADYVKKVMSAYKKLKPESAQKSFKDIKKALTAGYGGAGVPTANTGGGVLQSEALDDGRPKHKGFKYITCPECGYDQVYSKYQVKCRGDNCGKSFPMETLHKLFLGAIAT
jgi:ribosomal protein S27E